MATFLAMFSNVSSGVFFISRVEMSFHEKYKDFIEAIIGGKLNSIKTYKKRMFEGLASLLLSLAYLQFIVSIIIFFLAVVILPRFGFSGLVMEIYPQLAIGYYIAFLMYAELLFLYYYDDLTGAVINGIIFSLATIIGTIISSRLKPSWHGLGFTIGAFLAFSFAYFRIKWISKNINRLIFCKGSIIKSIYKEMPDSLVYEKTHKDKEDIDASTT